MQKNTIDKVKIMGVRLDSTSQERVLNIVEYEIERRKKKKILPFFIATPNPEIILEAQKDSILFSILKRTDLSLPDGKGLKLVSIFGKKITILPGRQIAYKIVERSSCKKWKVFLLGGQKNTAFLARKKLLKKFPNLKIFAFSGPMLDRNALPISEVDRRKYYDILDKLGKIRPDILFVGFGCPKQEKWISDNLSKLNAKIVMTVGGTLDYWAGKRPLPPRIVEKLGFEWLWRLIFDPFRLPRVLNAVFIFPIKSFFWFLMHKKNVKI